MQRAQSIRAGTALVLALFLCAPPAAAHIVSPSVIRMPVGGESYILVQDIGTCTADITATSLSPVLLQVCALDMAAADGSLLPGCNGTSVTVPAMVQQVFKVISIRDVSSPTDVFVRICWTANPFGGSCTENNCPTGVLVKVTIEPRSTTDGALLFATNAGDPINSGTGELFLQEPALLDLDGLFFALYYASRLELDGAPAANVGTNWRHNFDWKLELVDVNVEVTSPEGRLIRFEKGYFGTEWELSPYDDIAYQLVESGSDYVLGDPRDQRMYTFNSSGRLTKIEDGRGNVWTLSYTSGRLSQATDNLGRTLSFAYNGAGKLVSASDGTRSATLAYDASGNLVSATDPDGETTTYAYDAMVPSLGRMISRTRPEGNVPYTQVFDTSGRVTSQTDALGNVTSLSFDAQTGETTVTDPLGNARVHEYGAENELVDWEDETGASVALGYDALGRRDQIDDRVGATTSWTLDLASSLVASETAADGAQTSYARTPRTLSNGLTFHDLSGVTRADGSTFALAYDAKGNLLARTDPLGNVASFTYDSRGQPLTLTNAAGGTTTITYNPDETPASATDPAGNASTFAYDALKRVTQVVHPDGTSLSYAYDALDRVVSITDELGKTTSIGYDANGNPTSVTDPLSGTRSYAYDAMDRLVLASDELGNATSFTYDELGRFESVTDPNGSAVSVGYDSRGRPVELVDGAAKVWLQAFDAEAVLSLQTNPLGKATTFESDSMGRITRATSALGNEVQAAYDLLGLPTQLTDPLGNAINATYDAAGRTTGIALPVPGIDTAYAYDALGDLTAITDPRGNLWEHTYDLLGRRTGSEDPLGNQRTYLYDTRSRLAHADFPGGLGSVDFTYDAASRLVRRLYSDGTDLQFTWDAKGRMTSASGASFAWDAADRLVASNGIALARDAGGRLVAMTLAPGKTVTIAYDSRDLPVAITDWVGGMTAFTYDAASRLVRIERPNGVVTTFAYDADDRLVSIKERGPTGKVLAHTLLERDARGFVTSAQRRVPEVAKAPAGSSVFAYDAANRVTSFTYDALGRLLDDGERTYGWDLASRLSSITDGTGTVSFTHDALGNVKSRTESGVTREYVWNHGLSLPSISIVRQGGVDLCYFVHAPDGSLLHFVETSSGARRFFHYDEVGSTLFLTDDAGKVTDSYAYTPYGVELLRSGTSDNSHTWHGRYGVLCEGEIYLMRARVYDPSTGRFISPDPIEATDPQSVNPYQAFLQNPLAFVDPRGTAAIFLPFFDGGPFDEQTEGWGRWYDRMIDAGGFPTFPSGVGSYAAGVGPRVDARNFSRSAVFDALGFDGAHSAGPVYAVGTDIDGSAIVGVSRVRGFDLAGFDFSAFTVSLDDISAYQWAYATPGFFPTSYREAPGKFMVGSFSPLVQSGLLADQTNGDVRRWSPNLVIPPASDGDVSDPGSPYWDLARSHFVSSANPNFNTAWPGRGSSEPSALGYSDLRALND